MFLTQDRTSNWRLEKSVKTGSTKFALFVTYYCHDQEISSTPIIYIYIYHFDTGKDFDIDPEERGKDFHWNNRRVDSTISFDDDTWAVV